MTQPNILLIIADQHRTDSLGFMGRTPCQTPHIDRLAGQGVSFDRALSPCPLCTPARSSIFTGYFPHQTDMMTNGNTLHNPPVFTDLLREQGYHTDYAGKWHLDDDILPDWFDRDAGSSTVEYSEWCAENGLPDGWAFNDYAVRTHREPQMSIPKAVEMDLEPANTNDAWITDHCIRFIESRPKDKPFFTVCGFNGPHPPLKIPEPFFSMYEAGDIPQPPNFGPQAGEPAALASSYYRALWNDHGDEWEAWKKSWAVYWGFVSLIDAQVGRLTACLESQGVLDDTLVIFCADHGEMLGQHGLWHKMHAYEESLRVPLVMRPPGGLDAGIRSQAGASLIDIMPTVLSTAGITPPADMGGIDLTPAFHGSEETLDQERILFSEHKPLGEWHGAPEWRMVTDNQHKYTWNCDDRDEMYDLAADPYEKHNLIDDPEKAEVVAGFRDSLRDWMEETNDPMMRNLDV